MRRFLLSFALLTAALAAAPATRADDSWNPFWKPEGRPTRREPRPEPRPEAPLQAPLPPHLPPMQGNYPPYGPPYGPRHGRPGEPQPAQEPKGWPQQGGGQGPPPYIPYPDQAQRPSGPEEGPEQRAGKQGDVVVTELAPPTGQGGAQDGSGLPQNVWSELNAEMIAALAGPVARPMRSAALADLWRRLWRFGAAPGGREDEAFTALRIEALYRVGALDDLAEIVARKSVSHGPASSTLAVLTARTHLLEGRREEACEAAKAIGAGLSSMSPRLRNEALPVIAWCGVRPESPTSAGLAADLLRDQAVDAPVVLAVLEALSRNSTPTVPDAANFSALDVTFLKMAKAPVPAAALARADVAALNMLAGEGYDPALRIASAEAAARVNGISPAALAGAYGAASRTKGGSDMRRAVAIGALVSERDPTRQLRHTSEALAEAQRAGLLEAVSRVIADIALELQPDARVPRDAETVVLALLVAGRPDRAREWIAAVAGGRGGGLLDHWLTLADIADPALAGRRGQALPALEAMVRQGAFSPLLLHRLASVLDALDYQIPIPLWEAASRTPQPTGGHLPETGVLAALQQAAAKKEVGRTILLAVTALGHEGAEGAHLLALTDVIRALKQAGLEREARRLGLEALHGSWPRVRTP